MNHACEANILKCQASCKLQENPQNQHFSSECCLDNNDSELRYHDSSTIASSRVININQFDSKKHETNASLNNIRKNYNCYFKNCKKGYKYLYMFKYHLAGHQIFHFDCNLCSKRFHKFLLFKKHFKANHEMEYSDYKVSSITNEKASINSPDPMILSNAPQLEPNMKRLDEMLIELVFMLNFQRSKQIDDFMNFNSSMLQIRSEEFPSFSRCLKS